MRKVVTLCGLAGSGKGTIARMFANRYGWKYVDIGLIFRAIAYTSDTFREFSYLWEQGRARIVYHGWAGDKDITQDLQSEEIAQKAARMAANSLDQMIEIAERILAGKDNLICDGRNAGTTIFPNAKYKFYATASAEVRAKRRQKDLQALGYQAEYQDVLRDIKKRDRIDSERIRGKAEKPKDAIELDTERLSVEKSVELIALIAKI